MDALKLACATLALCVAAPAHADPLEAWRAIIAEASARFGVPAEWISQVMRAESAGRTTLDGRLITSRAGAMGLMQVMPDTYAAMRRLHDLGPDPYDAHDNIMAGAAYLRAMYDRFGYPGLFAAYNAGPGRYAEHLATGRPLPGETQGYIASLARTPATPAMPPAILSGTRLFFTLSEAPKSAQPTPVSAPEEPSSEEPSVPPSSGLFVPLTGEAEPATDRP